MAYVTSKTGMEQRTEARADESDAPPRPGTRHVYLPSRFSPNPEDKVRITLPLEPWHGGDAK